PFPSLDLGQGLATYFHACPPRVSSRTLVVILSPMTHSRESRRPASRPRSLARSLGAPPGPRAARAARGMILSPPPATRRRAPPGTAREAPGRGPEARARGPIAGRAPRDGSG